MFKMKWLKGLVKYKEEEKKVYYVALFVGTFFTVLGGLKILVNMPKAPIGSLAEFVGYSFVMFFFLFFIVFYSLRNIRDLYIKRKKTRRFEF